MGNLRFPMVPDDGRELAACASLSALAVAAFVGLPVVMGVLHMGGVF